MVELGSPIHSAYVTASPLPIADAGGCQRGGGMDDNEQHEHPTGALLLILIYLMLVVSLWIHVYLRLWARA